MASNKHPGAGGSGGTPLFAAGFPPQSTVSQSGLSISHAITTAPLHLPIGVSASRIATASPLALPVTLGPASGGDRIALPPSVAHPLGHATLQSPHITAVRVVSRPVFFTSFLVVYEAIFTLIPRSDFVIIELVSVQSLCFRLFILNSFSDGKTSGSGIGFPV